MKKTKKILYLGLVITIVSLLCLQAGAITLTNRSTELDQKLTPSSKNLFAGNTLISADNPNKHDTNPKMTRNGLGNLVVVYQKEVNPLLKTIPVCYSADSGDSWAMAFNLDSSETGSGVLMWPDVDYSPTSDEIFVVATDPGDEYSAGNWWFDGDIANAEEAKYAARWTGGEDAGESAVTYVGEYCVRFNVGDGYGIEGCAHLFYATVVEEGGEYTYKLPSDINADWAGGSYYDGQSILVTGPVSHPAMATGPNRMFMVMETETDEGIKISYKSTVTDLNPDSDTFLFTNGGGPGGMDKYADIEVWPWQMYIAEDATDPEVSAGGSNVCVVYTQDGDVKCSYSSDDGETWGVSIVASDAGFSSVYVAGNNVYCAYVKDGNVYRVISENGGAAWGQSEQINDVDGTVAGEADSVHLIDSGVVWTDTRNGAKDVYFGGGISTPVVTVKSISGGFGVSAEIANEGTADATNVQWSIDLEGGLVIIGSHADGTISTLAAGTSQTVKIGFVLGIGGVTITAAADGASKTASGTVLGPFVIGL